MMIPAPSEVCAAHQIQNCHCCDRMECCDNTSPAKKKIRQLEATLEDMIKSRQRWIGHHEKMKAAIKLMIDMIDAASNEEEYNWGGLIFSKHGLYEVMKKAYEGKDLA